MVVVVAAVRNACAEMERYGLNNMTTLGRTVMMAPSGDHGERGGMAGWRMTREAIAADRQRLREYIALHDSHHDRQKPLPLGFLTMFLHRIAHYLYINEWRLLARLVWLVNIIMTGADIGPAVKIGKGTIVPYPRTVTIYGTVGENCVFDRQSGIGGILRPPLGVPTLGDGVVMAPGSLILGPIAIGDRVRVGACCVITKSLPDDAEVVPHPWPVASSVDAPADPFRRSAYPSPSTRRITWRETRDAMRDDRKQLHAYYRQVPGIEPGPTFLHAGYSAIRLHRIAHYLQAAGWARTARAIRMVNMMTTGADFDPAASIGGGMVIPNPQTVSVSGRIGANCLLMAHACIGGSWSFEQDAAQTRRGATIIGNDVEVAPGAMVLGRVRVGNRVRIGARCLVTQDLPDDSELQPMQWRATKG